MALGGLALSTRRWPEAEAAFNQAAQLDPQLEQAWLTLARLRAAMGDTTGAEAYLQKGMGYAPHSVSLLLERGDLDSRRGDERRAIGWYRRILGFDAVNVEAWLSISAASLRLNDGAGALESANKAIALAPQNAEALVLAAIGHFMLGDLPSAKEKALRARTISPDIQLPEELNALLSKQPNR